MDLKKTYLFRIVHIDNIPHILKYWGVITFNGKRNDTIWLGDILQSDADTLVNTVNTEGVLGKGIALQFKKAFPHNYKVYRELCESNGFSIGKLLVVQDENLVQGKNGS